MKTVKILAISALMFGICGLLHAGLADRGTHVTNNADHNVTVVIKGAANNILAQFTLASDESNYQEIMPQDITKITINGQEKTVCKTSSFSDLEGELIEFTISGSAGAYELACQAPGSE